MFSKDNQLCTNITVDIAAAHQNTTVFYNLGDRIGVALKSSGLGTISVDCLANQTHENITDKSGMFFMSSQNVAITLTSYSIHSAETALLFPQNRLGRKYTAASYKPSNKKHQSYISVYSTFNDTEVKVYNDDYTTKAVYKLNGQESLKLVSDFDLTGYQIESNHPVSVITGTLCASVPNGINNCDMLMESMVPADVWDTTYIIPPIFPIDNYEVRFLTNCRSRGTIICTTATSTSCFTTNKFNKTFTFGNEATVVTSVLPVGVVQYGTGADNLTHQEGDPFMTTVPGLNNYLNKYTFTVPEVYKQFQNYIAIIVQRNKYSGLIIDNNKTIKPIQTYNVSSPYDDYIVVVTDVSPGRHVMRHEDHVTTFGLMVYGVKVPSPKTLVGLYVYGIRADLSVGYGYPAGLNLTTIGQYPKKIHVLI